MNERRRASVEAQRVEELCAASIRAVSGRPRAHLRAGQLFLDAKRVPVHAPHLEARDGETLEDRRAAADAMALLLEWSDRTLHDSLRPAHPVSRLVFEMLEQFRVESLADGDMHGVAGNLARRFSAWTDRFAQSGLVDTDLGLLLFAVALICRARIAGGRVDEAYEDLLEPTRAGMAPLWGVELEGLRDARRDQRRFAGHALAIAAIVARSVDTAREGREAAAPANDVRRAIFSLLIDFDDSDGEGFTAADSGDSKVLAESDGYRVFTRRYDRVVDAANLVRRAQLEELRGILDDRVAARGINVARLSRLLARMFAEPSDDGFSFGEESGLVDGRRLGQLIASPAERRLFRLPRTSPRADCALTLLIDCSGSMKRYIEPLGVLVDVLTRALDQAGVVCEVLGYTTNAWSGGRAQRDWLRAGRPPHPGRLNETCQIVFKDADTSWRRARRELAALLRPDLFREGIDGEAVEWAARRMATLDVTRRFLVVVSDGSPMDTATALANDPFYLDNHLRRVLERVQARGLQVIGLGVGLDLAPYFQRSLAVDLDDGVDMAMLLELLEAVRGRHNR